MKKLFTLIFSSVALLASGLQEVSPSFSLSEREILFKELQGSSSEVYASKIYDLKKGWNKLTTPLEGVNVVQTFSDISKVKFIAVYDDVSKAWAIYPHEKKQLEKEILFLKYLEPNVTFFVLALENVKVDIKANAVNSTCRQFMKNAQYDFLVDSGMNTEYALSKDETISVKSRYFSQHEQGIYTDTRVMLIYPKLDSKTKRSFRYGPAMPKTAFEFTKEYEGQRFYVYDYKEQKCFEGIFPSMKIPPFPTLKELK